MNFGKNYAIVNNKGEYFQFFNAPMNIDYDWVKEINKYCLLKSIDDAEGYIKDFTRVKGCEILSVDVSYKINKVDDYIKIGFYFNSDDGWSMMAYDMSNKTNRCFKHFDCNEHDFEMAYTILKLETDKFVKLEVDDETWEFLNDNNFDILDLNKDQIDILLNMENCRVLE